MRHKPDIEILGGSVRNAIGAKLMEIFPGLTASPQTMWWYRDFVTNIRYPHFFVSQLSLSSQEDRKGWYFLRYLMTIRYRVQEEPSRNTNLNAELDNVGFQMIRDIDNIEIGPSSPLVRVRVTGARYEKADGVLHYFGNVLLQVTYEQAETIKQQHLNLSINLKEE